MVAQNADAFNLDFDDVARLQRPDPGGRAGEDDVARLERHHGGDELDYRRAGKDHQAGAAVLFDDAIHARAEREIGRVEVRLDAGADGTESIEAFSEG